MGGMEKTANGVAKPRSGAGVLPRRGKKENAPVAVAEAGDAYRERLELVQGAMQSTLVEGERWMSRCTECQREAPSEAKEEADEQSAIAEHSKACVGTAGEHRPVADKMAVGECSMLASHGVVRVLVRKTRHLASIGRTIRICRGAKGDEVEEGPLEGPEKRAVKGVLCLTPVEALHLIDRRVMLLLQQHWSVFEETVPNGPFLSLSESYCLLLGTSTPRGRHSSGVALLPFSVFSHMKKLGYVLFSTEPGTLAPNAEAAPRTALPGVAAQHRRWWPPMLSYKSTLVPCFDADALAETSSSAVSWTPTSFQAFCPAGHQEWLTKAANGGWSFFAVYPASKEFSRSKSQPSLLLACASFTALDASLPLSAVTALIEWARTCHSYPLPLALCLGDAGLKLSFLSLEAGLAPPRPKSSRRKRG